jgi:hypothetical protein
VPPVSIETKPKRDEGMSIMSGAVAESWGASASTSSMIGVDGEAVRGRLDGRAGEAAGDAARSAHCTASGWRLRVACTDGSSGAICPVCSQQVGAFPDAALGPGVWEIQEHAAWAP